MKGIVTVDDIVDVVQEEATEDAQKFGGMEALDMPYLAVDAGARWSRKRGRWLDDPARRRDAHRDRARASSSTSSTSRSLALFLPLIISSGGNSGSQASTLVIRAMALGEVRAARLVARAPPRDRDRPRARRDARRASRAVRVLIWGAAGATAHGAALRA